MSELVIVYPNHPAWHSIDDDDWNGATFSNWLTTLKDCDVILKPSPDFSTDLVQRVYNIMTGCAKSVKIEAVK